MLSVIGVYNKHIREQLGYRVLGSCRRRVSEQCKLKGQYRSFKLTLGCENCRDSLCLNHCVMAEGCFSGLGVAACHPGDLG